jgi:hypothetical protein
VTGKFIGRLELFAMAERNSLWKTRAGLGDAMVMRWEHDVHIQDIRNHPKELLRGLESLLLKGASLTPDARHPGFFEVQDDTQVYYVHIVPNTRKVLLLAAWAQTELAATCS